MGYENLPKGTLFKKLKENYDIERLIRADSRDHKNDSNLRKRKFDENDIVDVALPTPTSSSSSSSSSGSAPSTENRRSKKRITLNKYDPIMFSPIDKKHVFKFSRPNGTVIRFNIESLVDYLLVSGDFSDPETRIPFSDEDLKEMDKIVRFYQLFLYLFFSTINLL